MLENPLHLTTAIAAIAALGFWLENQFPLAAKVGASLLVIIMGAIVSNMGWVPLSSPIYDSVYGPVTSLAIVWLLLAVDWRDLKAAGPNMLIVFFVAIFGTAVGALCAAFLIDVGNESWKLAGALTGSYSGGSLNLTAVGRELAISDSTFTAVVAADNAITAIWFGVTILAPVWLFRVFPRKKHTVPESVPDTVPDTVPGSVPSAVNPLGESPFKVTEITILLALGFAIMTLSEWAGNGYKNTELGLWLPIPNVLWLTSLSLVVGLLPAVRRLHGAFPLGVIALNVFFVVIGIGARFSEVFREGIGILFFTATIVAIHGAILFLFSLVRKIDWDLAAVASQAAIGGPSTAMALAVTRKRDHLVLPGIAVGLMGYAAGTYLGFMVAALLKGILSFD